MKAFAIGICAAVLAGALASGGGLLAEGRFLPRQDTAYTRELQVEAAGEKVREIAVVIEPQKLREEESRELLEEIRKRMDTYILGENRSLEEVRSDLHLIRRIEGTPVTAEWELDSYEVLNLDGSLRSENLREEGSLVELTARLFCNGQEAVYRACARVLPPVLGPEEQFYRELAAAVEKAPQGDRGGRKAGASSPGTGERIGMEGKYAFGFCLDSGANPAVHGTSLYSGRPGTEAENPGTGGTDVQGLCADCRKADPFAGRRFHRAQCLGDDCGRL